MRNNVLIDRALGTTPHPHRVTVCHSLLVCQAVAGAQRTTYTYTVKAWHHVTVDQSPTGAVHAIQFWFQSYSAVAMRVAKCESDLHWYSWNGMDDGLFQYELKAHPDIHVYTYAEQRTMKIPLRSQASGVWWSTQRAYRDSDGGTHWSPMWTCATKLGIS